MGSLFKKSVTRARPADGETFVRQGVRHLRWRDGKGKPRTAILTTGRDGTDRIRVEAETYTAKYRDGSNLIVEVATGCRDKSAAQAVLADLERQAERIRAGLLSPAEARIADHLTTPIGKHVADYLTSLESSGSCPKHVVESKRVLTAALTGCGFRTLADFDRSAVEAWLNARRLAGASGRTRNIDLIRLIAFANWLRAVGRLVGNPFESIGRASEAETKRTRRSLTEAELVRLLAVARDRPLQDALTIRTGPRRGRLEANVRDDVRADLEAVGRERALIYKTLVTTGLRVGELASLTAAQVKLDGRAAYIELDAADEKNRQGNAVPIRDDLADDLRAWLDDKPDRLVGSTPLFNVPTNLLRTFNRDLEAAGIAKTDDRGRTLDVHALRMTFGTLLSKGGVSLRTAQAAMRHSDPKLTANIYTDPRLLDVAGALDSLPSLHLGADPNADQERVEHVATGTYGVNPVAPTVAPNGDKASKSRAKPGKMNSVGEESPAVDGIVVSAFPTNEKASPVRRGLRAGEEIRTPDVQLGKQEVGPRNVPSEHGLRRPLPAVAPTVAPEIEIGATDDLDDLIADMSPADRARLADLIKKATGKRPPE